ncbi:MAG: hypothetical protein FJZ57_06455, partial [Chlamydiae bacterium]|nr:hypothetical protein [Chlamydiota bacterium]
MSINPISTSASALWEFFALDEDNPPPPIKASKEPEIRPLSTSFENRGLVRPTALKKNASFQSLQSIAEHDEANDEVMALKK